MTIDEINSIVAKNTLLDRGCRNCKNRGYNNQCTLRERAVKKITPQGFEWIIPLSPNNTCEKWVTDGY